MTRQILWTILMGMQAISALAQQDLSKDSLDRADYPPYVIEGSHPDYHAALPVFIHQRSKTVLNPSPQVDSIAVVLKRLQADPGVKLSYIWVVGSASPEGPESLNIYLAKTRMEQLYNWIHENTEIPDSIMRVRSIPENWDEVEALLTDNVSFPNRHRILQIINSEKNLDARERKIKAIDRGATWLKMDRELFPAMRNSAVLIVCDSIASRHDKPRPDLTVATAVQLPPGGITLFDPDGLILTIPERPEEPVALPEPEPRIFEVKTNALAVAAALVANLGFEIQLSRHWSVEVPVYYSPYDLFKETRKVRVLGTQPEVRYWLDRVAHRHFFGVHTHVTEAFNVAINDHGRYQDPHHPLWGMGVSYGYSLPLGESNRWGVDFTIGAGFANYTYNRYENIGIKPGQLNGYGKKRYWGITRAAVSFYYKFFLPRKK